MANCTIAQGGRGKRLNPATIGPRVEAGGWGIEDVQGGQISGLTPAPGYAHRLPTDAFRKIVPGVEEALEFQRKATPMGRNATFADVNEAMAFLASPASSFMTAQELVLDGGMYTMA